MSVLSLSLLVASLLSLGFNPVEVAASDGLDMSKVYGVKILWNSSMNVNDVAVSRDGNYIVAVNSTGLYYFSFNSSDPMWWYLSGKAEYFYSMVISADGEYVAAGTSLGYVYYFDDCRGASGERLHPTWASRDLWGAVERGTLDMSDDGEYVVVGGTGIGLYYFAGCRGRWGSDEEPTLSDIFGINDFLTVHMSSDGRYVAAGGRNETWNGFVMFYEDANVFPYPTEPAWVSWGLFDPIIDLAVSDDGYGVVAVSVTTIYTLYYWADATTLTENPNPTWTDAGAFNCVDMSADGDEVVAGTAPLFPCGLHFWSRARNRSGHDQEEDWTAREGEVILDLAVSDNGDLVAATTQIGIASDYKACFYKRDGSLIAEIDLPRFSPLVFMSGDGRIVAIGDSGPLTLHVVEVLEDLTPPLIENVYQQPSPDSVYPDDEVMVYANVSDSESGVETVFLNYTSGNGTWITVNMTNLDENAWNGTILAYEYCTWINFTIVAEDKVGNIRTSQHIYQYHVIPEFPSFLVLPLFMIPTLLVAIFYRRRHSM